MLVEFLVLFNTFLSLSYTQYFVPPTPSRYIGPPPFPMVTINLSSVSVCLLLFLLYSLIGSFFWISQISDTIKYLSLSVWFISFNIEPSKSMLLQMAKFYSIFMTEYYSIVCLCVFVMLVTQLCLILCDPMGYSPPGSTVHGILQARILE